MFGKKRRSELEFFRRDAGGEFRYAGGYCRYAGKPTRTRQLALLWTICGIGTLALIAAGCLSAPGMTGSTYVLIPYVAALIALCAGLWALGRLTLGGDPIRETDCACAESAPRRLAAAGVLSLLAMAGEGLYLLLHGTEEQPGAAAACMILLAASGILALLGKSRFRVLQWEKTS